MLPLESNGLLLRDFDRGHVMVDGNLLKEVLLVRIVASKELGLDEADPRVLQDLFFVAGLDVKVLDRLLCLRIEVRVRLGLG